MPTYEYACTECGEPLEAVQKFSDPALTVCPACGGRLRKVFSAAAIVFKGSGFYRTDSRGSSKGSATVAATDSAKKTEDKSETKSESKSESKPETKKTETKKTEKSSSGSSEKVA